MTTDLPQRRITRQTTSGTQSVTAPAGVSDEIVWTEVDRMKERADRGYVRPFRSNRGLKISLQWLEKQPRFVIRTAILIQRLSRIDILAPLYWLKWRTLDIYWAIQDIHKRKLKEKV